MANSKKEQRQIKTELSLSMNNYNLINQYNLPFNMSQFPHDDFVKEYLPELIKDYGIVDSAKKIASQTKEIDVFFQPHNKIDKDSHQLGLLRKLLNTTCLLEVYRNSVTANQINECIGKLVDTKLFISRENKRKKKDDEQVNLWLLTPTLSDKILNSFKAEQDDNWENGIYFLPPALSTRIIVIHRLPVNEETLWLRILGKGKVQEKAIEELKNLSIDNPYRDSVLELVSNLFTVLRLNQEKRQELTKEDQELIMKLSPIYEARLEEREQIGIQKGIQQNVIRLLNRKVGNLPSNMQTRVISLPIASLEDLSLALLDFNSIDDLTTWLNKNQ